MNREIARIKEVYRRRADAGARARYARSRPSERYFNLRRDEELLRLLGRRGAPDLTTARILDVGCGRGQPLADWQRWGTPAKNLYGIDLMESFLHEAKDALPNANLLVGSGDCLPFRDACFDIVVQLTMFTSILDPSMRKGAAAEMLRVLAPGGLIIWYDFRYPSPRNADVRPIGMREIEALFPGCQIEIVTITLVPPLARLLAPVSFALCRLLEAAVPLLRSHYLAVIRKSA
jgi:ubiquinone/menaquinone biosynthesis C-methylase UbiE